MLKITIITVCYNAVSNIADTIENVLGLNFPNIDFIIIDGASNDGTAEIINRYADNLTHYISEPDKGIYDAMNKGWKLASDDSFVLYLGAGDKLLNLPKLESFDYADVIIGNVQIGDKYLFKGKASIMLKLGNTIHHQAEFVKKSINVTPPFSLNFPTYADFNFNQKLLLMDIKFQKDDQFLSFALEGGVSQDLNVGEQLEVVKSNYGYLCYFASYAYLNIKKIMQKV